MPLSRLRTLTGCLFLDYFKVVCSGALGKEPRPTEISPSFSLTICSLAICSFSCTAWCHIYTSSLCHAVWVQLTVLLWWLFSADTLINSGTGLVAELSCNEQGSVSFPLSITLTPLPESSPLIRTLQPLGRVDVGALHLVIFFLVVLSSVFSSLYIYFHILESSYCIYLSGN